MADAIVIGGGIHGLAAAALLAQRGRKVLVLEAREHFGGVAAREEFAPGFAVPGALHAPRTASGRVVEDLALARHGLVLASEPEEVLLPEPSGRGLALSSDPSRARTEIAARSPRDAAAYDDWRAFLERVRGAVERTLNEPAPELFAPSPGDLATLLFTGLKLRRLGADDLLELLRVVPMCAADWLKERFEDPLLLCALAAPATRGGLGGPWAPQTASTLLFQQTSGGVRWKGGPAALADALANAARALGVELRISAPVREILVERGVARGVVLENGTREDAPLVVSALEPKRTLLGLVPPRALPFELARAIEHWRTRGTTAVVRLALRRPLRFRSRPEQDFAHAIVAGDLDQIERAFDAIKYRRAADEPWLDVRVPSLEDASLAPPGQHVVSIEAHAAPYDLDGGWSDAARERLLESVLTVLARVATIERADVVASEVLAPIDLERRYGLTGGQIHHGETTLDQLAFMRPAPSCARHATPIEGLYLCGPGTHPGPFVACASSALAVDAALSH